MPRRKSEKIVQAIDLYERFTGAQPRYIDHYTLPVYDVGMKIGVLEGVLYSAKRDGVTEKYFHEFKTSSRPLLASSWDGKQIYIIGGRYNFTEDGIVDK